MADVAAVIGAYRPVDLVPLLEVITPQVARVVVADDASPVTSDAALRAAVPRTHLTVRFDGNAGIARSMNAGLKDAHDHGMGWLLTLDQDSLPEPDHVQRLLEAARAAEASDVRVGAVGAAIIVGAAGELRIPATERASLQQAEELVMSGTLWKVDALLATGGFDTSLGMDAVDAEAGIRLQRSGWSLLVCPGLRLRHDIGASRPVRILGRTVQATSHSAARRESILRNRLHIAPKAAGVSVPYAVRTVRRAAVGAVLAVTVEEDRWAKAKGSLRALFPRRSK